jgi:hypothetical protein
MTLNTVCAGACFSFQLTFFQNGNSQDKARTDSIHIYFVTKNRDKETDTAKGMAKGIC